MPGFIRLIFSKTREIDPADGRSQTEKTEKADMVHMPAFSFPSESAAKERGDRRLPGMDQRRVLSRAMARARAALEW